MDEEYGTTQPGEQHRASDADRQRVADQLRQALDEGRLTLVEYDDRLRGAYGALTYGELAEVTRDLPASVPTPIPTPTPAAPVRRSDPRLDHLRRHAREWIGVAVIMIGIWAVTSVASGYPHAFWPGIPLGIWASVLIAGAIAGGNRRDGKEQGP